MSQIFTYYPTIFLQLNVTEIFSVVKSSQAN